MRKSVIYLMIVLGLLAIAAPAYACGYYYSVDHNIEHVPNPFAPLFACAAILVGFLLARRFLPPMSQDNTAMFLFILGIGIGILVPVLIYMFSVGFVAKVLLLAGVMFLFLWLFDYSMDKDEGSASKFASATFMGLAAYLVMSNFVPIVKPDATFGFNANPAITAQQNKARPLFGTSTRDISERARQQVQNQTSDVPEEDE